MIAGQGFFVVRAGIGCEDRGDESVGFGGGVVLFVDGDAIEECPVEHASFGGFCFGVDVADVGEESEDGVEPDLGAVVDGAEVVEPAGDRGEAGTDAVLLGFEQVDGDRVGVVGLEEFDLFGFELGLLSLEQVAFVAGGCGEGVEYVSEHDLDACGFFVGDACVLVGAFDAGLDAVHEHGGALAGVAFELASGAGEVVVGDALVVAGLLEHELLPAPAVDGAFEVVVVLLRLVADDVVLPQDGLDLLERFGRDERFVLAGVGRVSAKLFML